MNMDTGGGKRNGGGSVLLTLIERKTRKFIVRKIKNKTQESVTRELNKIENWINNYPRKLFDGSTSIEKENEFLLA